MQTPPTLEEIRNRPQPAKRQAPDASKGGTLGELWAYPYQQNMPTPVDQINLGPIADSYAGMDYDMAAASAANAETARRRALMDTAVAGINQNINSLGVRRDNSIQGVRDNYGRILSQYTDQEAQNANKFQSETQANEGTFSRNRSLALQSAATGRQGLMATLAAIGAVGPTALNLADRAVARSANLDLGDAGRTFETNATTLVDSYDRTKQEEKNRRLEAEAARDAEIQAAEYDYLSELQKAYQQMANTYAEGDAVAEAQDYTRRAGGLFGELAQKTRPVTAGYQKRDIGLDTSNLQKYLAGQRNNSVQVAGGTPGAINSPIYAISRRREELV